MDGRKKGRTDPILQDSSGYHWDSNNKLIHYRTNSVTKFFFKFKILFLVHFPNFGGKNSFSKKSGCHAQLSKGFQHPSKIQRNLMIKFQENTQTDVRREGWTNHISQDLSSYCQGVASTTAVDWHLKVKNKKSNVALIKNYCITVSMQKFSSIHKLIQQILGSHELNDPTHF